jgi:phosphoribosyl-dephospho-CoA transferase
MCSRGRTKTTGRELCLSRTWVAAAPPLQNATIKHGMSVEIPRLMVVDMTSSSKSLDTKKNNEEEAALANEVEQDSIAMLRSDHHKVEELFSSFEKATSPQEKAQLK